MSGIDLHTPSSVSDGTLSPTKLVQKGVVSDIQEAFALYLGAKGRAYFSKDKLGPEEAIRILKREGATVILAHPYSLELSLDRLRSEIQRFKDLGLDGLTAVSAE